MPLEEKKTLIKLSSLMIMGARDETIYKMKRKKYSSLLFPVSFLFNDHPQRNSVAICHYIRKARCVVCSLLFSLIHFHSRASLAFAFLIIFFSDSASFLMFFRSTTKKINKSFVNKLPGYFHLQFH